MKTKTAIITGSARGIGKHLAIQFSKKGYTVILASRSKNEIEDTLNQIQTDGGSGIAIVTDVSKKNEVNQLVSSTMKNYGTIDVLINNAGIITPIGPVETIDTEKWIQTIQINLFGTYFCTKAVLPYMIPQKKGKIINFSGGGAFNPFPNFSAYSTSKAAIIRFTETIAQELSQYNIDVNAIAPGPIKSKIMYDVIESGNLAGQELDRAKKVIDEGGFSLEKVSELALFLASEDSNGLTGKTISAKWDDLEYVRNNISKIQNSDKFTMKRMV